MRSYTRKLGKIGRPESGSYHITLPKELVQGLGWREGNNIRIRKSRNDQHLILEAVWYEKAV